MHDLGSDIIELCHLLPQTVIVDRIIWTVSYQAAKRESKWEEDLCSSLQPNCWVQQQRELSYVKIEILNDFA